MHPASIRDPGKHMVHSEMFVLETLALTLSSLIYCNICHRNKTTLSHLHVSCVYQSFFLAAFHHNISLDIPSAEQGLMFLYEVFFSDFFLLFIAIIVTDCTMDLPY